MGPPPQTISGLGKKEEKAGIEGPGNKKETNKTRRTFMAQLQASRKRSPGQTITYCWPSIPFFHLPSVPKYCAAVEATRYTLDVPKKIYFSTFWLWKSRFFSLAIVLLNKKESSPKVHFWGGRTAIPPFLSKKPRFFLYGPSSLFSLLSHFHYIRAAVYMGCLSVCACLVVFLRALSPSLSRMPPPLLLTFYCADMSWWCSLPPSPPTSPLILPSPPLSFPSLSSCCPPVAMAWKVLSSSSLPVSAAMLYCTTALEREGEHPRPRLELSWLRPPPPPPPLPAKAHRLSTGERPVSLPAFPASSRLLPLSFLFPLLRSLPPVTWTFYASPLPPSFPSPSSSFSALPKSLGIKFAKQF